MLVSPLLYVFSKRDFHYPLSTPLAIGVMKKHCGIKGSRQARITFEVFHLMQFGKRFWPEGREVLNISSSILFSFVFSIPANQRKILPSVTATKSQD